MSALSLLSDEKKKNFARKESVESVYSSSSRLSLLQKRKRLCPLQGTMPQARGDKFVTQRVLSAKTHRVKQLQNQLADAHYHLQELSNENRVLRAMQKKQDIALQRYESSNAELPQILNSHNEELRVHQTKYKQLKTQYRDTLQKLKEREMQLQQLKDDHSHLLELTRDKNLEEREKLQSQVSELTTRVQNQNETISQLQRRIVLEAKNFKHQLFNEMNKHKDTRQNLDLAINNADKLSSIIEFKDKMINTAAIRGVRSPTRSTAQLTQRPHSTGKSKEKETASAVRARDDRDCGDHANITRFCETSRTFASVLSTDEALSSAVEPRNKFAKSRSNSITPNQSRKNSKTPEEPSELVKTIQEGLTDLRIFNEELDFTQEGNEIQIKIDKMKASLMSQVKGEDEKDKKNSNRIKSRDESNDDSMFEIYDQERPKSRGRRNSSVSFSNEICEEKTTVLSVNATVKESEKKSDKINTDRPTSRSSAYSKQSTNNAPETDRPKPKREMSSLDRILAKPGSSTSTDLEIIKPKREGSNLDRILAGKPLEKYCKNIISDIEKSNKIIDQHLKDFSQSKSESDKLVHQLEAVDKINEFVNSNEEIPVETLSELNNNFKMLADSAFTETIPMQRKRSISGRRSNAICDTPSMSNPFGDASMSNQDLLNDILGRK